MPKKQKPKTDTVEPVPGWGRKDFFRDLKKAVKPLEKNPPKR